MPNNVSGVLVIRELGGGGKGKPFVVGAANWTLYEFQQDVFDEGIWTEILAYYPDMDTPMTHEQEEALIKQHGG